MILLVRADQCGLSCEDFNIKLFSSTVCKWSFVHRKQALCLITPSFISEKRHKTKQYGCNFCLDQDGLPLQIDGCLIHVVSSFVYPSLYHVIGFNIINTKRQFVRHRRILWSNMSFWVSRAKMLEASIEKFLFKVYPQGDNRLNTI